MIKIHYLEPVYLGPRHFFPLSFFFFQLIHLYHTALFLKKESDEETEKSEINCILMYFGAFVFYQTFAAWYLLFYFKSNENSDEKIHYLKLFQTLLFTEQRRRILLCFLFPFLMKSTVLWLGALRTENVCMNCEWLFWIVCVGKDRFWNAVFIVSVCSAFTLICLIKNYSTSTQKIVDSSFD